ncbi:hypothetical protein RYD26_07445 [Pasteurellaceae bacterium LIM206]|nr:hypothetical protein [Pasteurellaceae bacterium LIM206]
MPAERLTKRRLIQIVIMLIILVTAFLYKTCQYEKGSREKTQSAVLKIEVLSLPENRKAPMAFGA